MLPPHVTEWLEKEKEVEERPQIQLPLPMPLPPKEPEKTPPESEKIITIDI